MKENPLSFLKTPFRRMPRFLSKHRMRYNFAI